ncbi:DUF4419 domain-containing protein [Lentzea cavernae]|uniref:DUF4419 domain-containing protein n=1 Tax=Lentzea cavernae TaxID=2020703 RepID=UPI00174B536F|nr:DUF4419 domain-containing protein [Lentzea cavernae]
MTFSVDDVEPVTDLLPTSPTADLFPGALATGGDARVLEPNGVHPLLHAVGKAFAEHRPLVLSPDAVWLTIARGISDHVKLNAEELRPVLVGHEGKKVLAVSYGPADTWDTVVERFAKEIGDTTFDCDFSTSTDVERLAGRVAMMDAYSPYHGYWMIGVCGIPSITLTGSPDDWRRIRARVDDLPGFGLEHWCRSLRPITDEFVRAFEGDADAEFWKRIYNPVDAYGGEIVTGWITRFYPYLEFSPEGTVPNPMLDLPVGEPRDSTEHGLVTNTVPATLCRAVINVNDHRDISAVAVDAGLVGVTQHEDGALEPVAGWAVVAAPPSIEAVLDRVVVEHECEPPEPLVQRPGPLSIYMRPQGSGELIALYERLGAASLHGGSWRIRPNSARGREGVGRYQVDVVFDLADGRLAGEVADFRTGLSHWVLFRPGDLPEDVPVLGSSLAMLLESVLDHGEVAQMETMRLSELRLSHD